MHFMGHQQTVQNHMGQTPRFAVSYNGLHYLLTECSITPIKALRVLMGTAALKRSNREVVS